MAYGRYWGALERVDCLHFEACYYQPLQWCIAHGAVRFEGGAQGEHKMARALLPVQATSAHWLAHPAFAEAVQRFLDREGAGVENYLESLHQRLPFKQAPYELGQRLRHTPLPAQCKGRCGSTAQNDSQSSSPAAFVTLGPGAPK